MGPYPVLSLGTVKHARHGSKARSARHLELACLLATNLGPGGAAGRSGHPKPPPGTPSLRFPRQARPSGAFWGSCSDP